MTCRVTSYDVKLVLINLVSHTNSEQVYSLVTCLLCLHGRRLGVVTSAVRDDNPDLRRVLPHPVLEPEGPLAHVPDRVGGERVDAAVLAHAPYRLLDVTLAVIPVQMELESREVSEGYSSDTHVLLTDRKPVDDGPNELLLSIKVRAPDAV